MNNLHAFGTTVVFVVGVLIYVALGKVMGEMKYRILEKKEYSLISFFCFPYSHVTRNLSYGGLFSQNEDEMAIAHMLLWPVLVSMNFFSLLCVPLYWLIQRDKDSNQKRIIVETGDEIPSVAKMAPLEKSRHEIEKNEDAARLLEAELEIEEYLKGESLHDKHH